MSNLNIKPIVLLMACLCLLMALSCVSASEISDMNNVTSIDDTVSSDALASPLDQEDGDTVSSDALASTLDQEDGDTVSSDALASTLDQEDGEELVADDSYEEKKLAANAIGTDKGTFKELNEDFGKLEDDSDYYMEKDYVFNEETDMENPIINLNASYVTIYGNKHIIDANGSDLAKFIVTGHNLIIYDLIFKNFKATANDETSHIQWNGDKGTIENCDFYNCIGVNGGAITWNGNQGYIEWCLFENNTALNRGGAMYVTGGNTLIYGTTFITFTSSLSNEAIYYSNKNGQTLSIDNCDFRKSPTKVLWDEGCTVLYNGIDMSYETIEGLCRDIENLKPGDYYNIERDYVITNPTGDLARNRIINIKADNIVIDGNGHIIDCGGAKEFFAIFNITGNNVTITNLQIIKSRAYDSEYLRSNKNIYGNNYNHLTSPIEWHGDNGVISNCLFYDNVGENGGAIYWAGNNGKIENTTFDENGAIYYGGSVYVSGNGNLIKDCTFNNTDSTFTNDAIYFKGSDNPKLTINNCLFESTLPHPNNVVAENGCEVIFEGNKPQNIYPPMSFKELIQDLEQLKDGDTYNFDRDCYFYMFDGDLTINGNNIIINGNGYKIYGEDSLTCLFNIYGNNIQINNLTFDFKSNHNRCPSFITLTGENATLSNCVFIGNAAQSGGTVNWNVNNGIIDSCIFINNDARAIYVDGTNNIISNSSFINSFSSLKKNETIYCINTNGRPEHGKLTINNCSFESDIGVKIWIDDDSDVIIDGKSVPNTIDDLYNEISNLNDNEVYDIYRDYYTPSKSLIIKNDNITINANGHRIIALDDELNESLICVEGNGITINRLTINANSNLRSGSLIDWRGNDGVLSDSTLIGNTAQTGGAVSWSGDNGIISYSTFINTTADFGGAVRWNGNYGIINGSNFIYDSATYAGGAIFIDGTNNIVANSTFISSGSKMADESIFIGYTRKNITLENILFADSCMAIDAFASNFDVDYLTRYIYIEDIADESVNLNPLIYISIMKGGINSYSDDISYYSSYNNETGDFVFTLVKEFSQFNISYSKEFIFKNLFELNIQDVFDLLFYRDFENRFTITKTEYIDSAYRYTEALSKIYFLIGPDWDEVNSILIDDRKNSNPVEEKSVIFALNVIFTEKLVIDCDLAWDLSISPYDSITFDGKGSSICGSYKCMDEDKWVILGVNKTLFASNIAIRGFNTAVENMGGLCIFGNVIFRANRMDYLIERDWGAAILNTGTIYCINCTFEDNYAKNGGAIFNQGLISLQNCSFIENEAYGKGPDICVGDGGEVLFNGVNITENGQVAEVYFPESMSLGARTGLAIFSYVMGFVVGFIAGLFTANPVVAVAAGAGLGALIGIGCSAEIISEVYDVNYDRLGTCLNLIIGSTLAGAQGGFLGTLIGIDGALEGSVKYALRNSLGSPFAGFNFKTFFAYFGGLTLANGLVGGISYYYTND